MKRIHLSIRAEDILKTRYTDAHDCAITRALERGGYADFRHEGTDIVHTVSRETIVDTRNKSFKELTQLVWDMYDAKEEKNFGAVESFQFVISY
jgi:hypothetical protein